MNTINRLKRLSAMMEFEPAEDLHCPQPSRLSARQQDAIVLTNAMLPNGKYITLLKTLLTSSCERNCFYCPFRAGRDFRRATLTPDEMAKTFMILSQSGIVQGIFLSSGIVKGGVCTQDKLLATTELLRHKYRFRGYIHLKLMPGVETAQIEHAMQMVDRLSINLEAPNSHRLELLAPRKIFLDELIRPLKEVSNIRHSKPAHLGWKGHWPSTATQFVVGAVGESDVELLSITDRLYKEMHLARTFFSAFNPVKDTPFESLPPTSPTRELRLYQASYLLKEYYFKVSDFTFESSGNLPINVDPKLVWAQKHLSEAPLEINKATRIELLRVPGIGTKGVNAILSARRNGTLSNIEDLRKIGINPTRMLPYILINGIRPLYQLPLL